MMGESTLKKRLVSGGIGIAVMGIVDRGIGFLIAIALARMLGSEGYGFYSFAGGLISLMAIPAQLGMPKLLSRQIAFYSARKEWSLMSGIRSWSIRFSVISSIVVGVLLVVSVMFVKTKDIFDLTSDFVLLNKIPSRMALN